MATANKILTRAFSRAGIRDAESAIEPNEIQDGLDLLNDMGSNWEQIHHLGFSPVANVTDEVRIPRYANEAFIDSLAIKLCTEFSKPVSPSLAGSAKMSLSGMLVANVNLSDVDMPSTLPLGSGNHCDDGDDSRFFAQKDKVNF